MTSKTSSALFAIILSLLVTLAGCNGEKGGECNPEVAECPAEDTAPPNADTDTDSDADTDSDSDADSDSDTDADTDTDPPDPPDEDGDGYPVNEDCDDADATVYPGAPELCDGIDNDCDGATDEETPTWYRDADADGYGDVAIAITQCEAPAGFVANADDCDDTDDSIHPGATELCDGIDNDCDGTSDEGFDADTDGFTTCQDDCDDTDSDVNPSESETPYNGVDDDCDGNTEDDDLDGDGYDIDDDCDDLDGDIHPDATETCNGDDDDCDGNVDEDASDASTWYLDDDGDGFGDPDSGTDSCDAPTGYVADSTDCDDGDADSYPGATEVEDDGVDQDCDGSDLVSLTSEECWDSVAYEIQYYAIDWSSATTASTDWSAGLDWVDTDPVQVLDASSSSSLITIYDQDYGGCSGTVLETSIYLPDGYAFPDLGDQYNNGIVVVLQPDGTVYEVNYLEDCGDGTWAGYVLPDSSPLDACDSGIDSSRYLGAHGGSHITATQAIREGELTGSSAIGRPLPVEVDHTHLYYDSSESDGNSGFRWPAASADWYASSLYSGTNADVQMGSILVLPESYDCTVMSTTPGERLCEVARDHGFIVVDDSYGEEEVAFPIEPDAQAEVESDLGHSLHDCQSTGFGGDVEDIFGDIEVLTNPTTAWVQ